MTEIQNKKILIIGSGGREHALGWKLRQSPHVKKIFFAPGNGGTQEIGVNIPITVEDVKKLASWAKKNSIDLTVVGPEAPLSLGIVDEFEKQNLSVFGPTKKAARLETDKAWAVQFMEKYHIPHPSSSLFTSYKDASSHILSSVFEKMVIKASGLAAGKGVFVCDTKKEALDAVKRIMVEKEFGNAGDEILIQERIYGEEISVLAFCDGTTAIPLLPAQDHKRAYDNDTGPNTGGMGAYAPVPFVSPQLIQTIRTTILQPTIDAMKKEHIPYKGILFAGLMLTDKGPKVLEYNVRFGDPETQPLILLLETDLYEIFMSCIDGALRTQEISFRNESAACVVLTSKGYPGAYEKGVEIRQKKSNAMHIFHAGTAIKNNRLITSGGRAINVCAHEKTLSQTLKNIYSAIQNKEIYFEGMHYRKDIGKKYD